jgi:type I restriction enzyme M protein
MGSDSEGSFAGLFDDVDVNRNKLGPAAAKRTANLVKLIEGVAGMGLNYKKNAIDAFGDAYEHPMGMYAPTPERAAASSLPRKRYPSF